MPVEAKLISEEELARVARPLAEASLLPPRVYSDPAIFAMEKERIFMRNWVALAHISEVPQPGDFLTRSFFGEPVLIVRDADGVVHALSNVCRHRARQVAEGEGNCLSRGGFRCPYHAWVYDSAGALKYAPHMEATADFRPSDWRLPQLRMEIWEGFVFVNFDADAAPLGPQLETLRAVMAPFNMAEMQCVSFTDYEAPWNWKATMENFSEAYHQPQIHADTFEPWCPARMARYEDVDGPYGLFWMPTEDGGALPTSFPPMEGLPADYYSQAIVVNIMPLFHLLIDPAAIVFLDWDIMGPQETRLIWKLLVPKSTFALPDFEARKAQFLKTIRPVWHEDDYACRGLNAGVGSRFAEQGRLSHMERTVHQFQQWLAAEYQRS